MLKMAQQQYIKHLYEVEERSLNEIAEMTGFNFRTVQKYAYQDNWSVDHLPDVEPGSYPVLGDFIPVIDLWLEEDRRVPRKQRHTIQRIYDRLRDECGFTGSYSSVKRYVRKKKFVLKMTNDWLSRRATARWTSENSFTTIPPERSRRVMRLRFLFRIPIRVIPRHSLHRTRNACWKA